MEYASGFIDITPTTKACLGGWSKRSALSSRVASNIGNTMDYITVNPFGTNDAIRKEARTIIDFSEVDPFSDGAY